MKVRKIEGGSGGKRGHSNMAHWEKTETIKTKTKVARRRESKEIARKVMSRGEVEA